MSFDVLGDVNWLAILVATAAYFVLGGLWYTRLLFGNVWVRASNIQMPEGESPGPAMYIGPLVTCLIATIALAMLAVATGSDTLAEGIVLGIVAGLGVAGATLFVTGFFDTQKPQRMVAAAVSIGYHLVGLTLAAAIVSAWG